MKRFKFLLLGLATLCIVSCGNKKDPLEKALDMATEAAELSESIEDVVETVESSDAESDEAYFSLNIPNSSNSMPMESMAYVNFCLFMVIIF